MEKRVKCKRNDGNGDGDRKTEEYKTKKWKKIY